MPATPIATSTMPVRNGRPNESLTTTPTSRPVRSPILLANGGRGSVGVDGQQHERPGFGRVRRVDAGRRADEPVARLGNHEGRSRADDARRLAEDHLEVARVVPARELDGRGRRLDVVEADDAPLRLRHDLLRDDDDVGVLELELLGDERARGRPLHDLREAFDRDDAELRQLRAPPRRARGGSRRRA